MPDYVLTNKELESMVDTSNEWIVSRTGISERRILKTPGLGSSHMGVKAIEDLLRKTSTSPKEIDAVLCATVTPDMLFPCNASLISHEIGASNILGFDVNAACSGFLYTLEIGSRLIQSGNYQKVIVVGADKMSSIVDYDDRATCVLFGDGAGAILLEPELERIGILDSVSGSDGEGKDDLYIRAGGSLCPASAETVARKEHYLTQEGMKVFKVAITAMAEVTQEIMNRNALTIGDIDFFIPHQANQRIISSTAQRVGLPESKVLSNIKNYGNTTSASVPLCMWDNEQKFKKGDDVIITVFGGGYTWGSVYLKWAYNGS